MNTKHIFVSVLDLSEQLPFAVRKTTTLQQSMEEQDRAKRELHQFVQKLEKNLKEEFSYIGMDVIGEKSYERFMLQKSGFFEIMMEPPAAMTAHFPDRKRAERFCAALKKALLETLPIGVARDTFVDSLEVQDEQDTSLTVEGWHRIKDIRG